MPWSDGYGRVAHKPECALSQDEVEVAVCTCGLDEAFAEHVARMFDGEVID